MLAVARAAPSHYCSSGLLPDSGPPAHLLRPQARLQRFQPIRLAAGGGQAAVCSRVGGCSGAHDVGGGCLLAGRVESAREGRPAGPASPACLQALVVRAGGGLLVAALV